MANIVRFDQDPSMPAGTGTFHFDDGRQLYAQDPQTAASVSSPQQPSPEIAALRGPDMRTASNGKPGDQMLDAGGPAMGFDQFKGALDKMNFGAAPPPATGGGPPGAPPGAAEMPDPDAAYKRNLAATLRQSAMSGPTRGGMLPRGQQQTITTEGMPYDRDSPEYKERQDAAEKVRAAGLAQSQVEAELPRLIHEHAEAQLPDLMKERDRARADLDDQRNRYKSERGELDSLLEQNRKRGESYNANRWFENQSIVGQIGAVLVQAFGAKAAMLGRGENYAQKIIDGYVQRDIDTQKQQILEGKEGANNALARLRLHFGDMQQAEAALKIAQNDVLSTQIKSYAASTNNKEIIAKGDSWAADLDQKNVTNEQAFQNASYGKRSLTTSATYQAPSSGGFSTKKALETAAELEKLGVPKEDIQEILLGKKQGGAAGMPDDIDPKNVVRTEHGDTMAFSSEKRADKFAEASIPVNQIRNDIAKVKALRNNPKSFVPGTNEYGERENAEKGLLLGAPKALHGLGRFTEKEEEMSSAGMNWFNKEGALDSLDAMAKEKLDLTMQAYGGKAVSEVTTKNEKGQRGVGYRYLNAPKSLRTYSSSPGKKPESSSSEPDPEDQASAGD